MYQYSRLRTFTMRNHVAVAVLRLLWPALACNAGQSCCNPASLYKAKQCYSRHLQGKLGCLCSKAKQRPAEKTT